LCVQQTHLGTRTSNWRLEAAITGTLGSVPPHRGGLLPASQRGFQPRDPSAVSVLGCVSPRKLAPYRRPRAHD
jgi:hypothetical protein